MKLLISIIVLIFTSACSSEKSSEQAQENKQNGEFNLELTDGKGFTHESKKFKIINATSDYFEFKSFGWHTRFSASQLDESSPSSSSKLIYNNTFVSFYTKVKGKRTNIHCKTDQDPIGEIKITAIENNTFSGEFEFELVGCKTFYTSEVVTELGYPFKAKGTFSNVVYESHLEKLMNKKKK